MSISIQCKCSEVQGRVQIGAGLLSNRVICYCNDCQAFIRHLNRENDLLDEHGGSDIWQVTPSQLAFHKGQQKLECMSLSPKGLLRWYTGCCNTPIGNTLRIGWVPVVGIPVQVAVLEAEETHDQQLGPVLARIQTRYATGKVDQPSHQKVPAGFIMKTIAGVIVNRLRGRHQPSPYFGADGKLKKEPHVLPIADRRALY